MSDKKLYENLEGEFGTRGLENLKIPSYIKDNLSKELRVYQKQALKYYFLNFDSKYFKTNHLMFNMATGSGKTLMMASLILDCYKRGYKDFIFFVNSTSIVEKTKANFADKVSSKYLFKDPIIIDSTHVEINLINHLDESKEGCINLYFTTIQSLFSLLKYERENALSFEDLKERKLVFLADEAHHLNSDTKKANPSKEEKEIKEGWEAIIKWAFESHKENLMFEFSATIPKDINVLEKYRDKIIYEYDLARFCKDGYSKRIFVMKYENPNLQDRFLGGILLSLYRELLAQKYKIALKPVVLFKSETIKNSKGNQEAFIEFLDNLDIHIIKAFYQNLDLRESELFAKSLEFFQSEFGEAYLQDIIHYLQNNFKSTYILNTNDEKELEKNQILLNSLEDSSNEIRVIFTVDKLNEGWDVLNLFDIVRLGSKSSGAVTTKEAQLIGRGARYYPFISKKIEINPELAYKRKFDNDLESELSMLERLSYHTLNEVEFIKNLNKSMMDQGLLFEDMKKRFELTPNKKLENIIKDNKIYYAKNKRIKKQDLKYFEITREEMEQKIKSLNIPLIAKGIKENEEKFEKIKEEYDFQKLTRLGDHIPSKFFLKAMNMLGLSFEELNGNFDFKSKNEFVEEYLKNIYVCFSRKQKFNLENNLEIAKFILENFKKIKEQIKQEYEVTNFETHKLNLGDRVIFRSENKETADLSFDWLYYHNISLDSKLEEDFLYFIDGNKEAIDAIFSQWFIVRNDGFEEFKIYDNRKGQPTYGYGFEPDFIFFEKKKNENDHFLSIECFFEAKGGHLSMQDAWKEEFLQTIQNKRMYVENSHKLTLYSLPFFISKEIKQNAKFIDAFNCFLKN